MYSYHVAYTWHLIPNTNCATCLLGSMTPVSCDYTPYIYIYYSLSSGDACDTDIDGDGIDNLHDNCIYVNNPGQADSDGMFIGKFLPHLLSSREVWLSCCQVFANIY